MQGVTYKIVCETCRHNRTPAYYYGESSRTPYIRGLEHLADRVNRKEDSPIYKHDRIYHSKLENGSQTTENKR